MNNTQKIALNTAVQLVGKTVTVATSILIIAYLARYLGVQGYGDYATIFAYLGVFGTVLDLGLFVTAVREIAKEPLKEKIILSNMMGLKLSLSLIVLGAGYALSFFLPYPIIVRQGILIGAISQLFMSLNQVPLGSFQVNLTMYKATFSDVVGRFLLLGVIWWLIQTHAGLLDVVWGVAMVNMVVFLINIILISRNYLLRPLFNWIEWRQLLMASLPIGVVMVLGVIYFRIDMLILAAIKGSFAVGIYSAPYKILEVLLAVPSIFMSSVLPIMAIALQQSTETANRIFQRSLNFLSLIVFPLIAGTVVIATPVMVLIAGSDFRISGPILQILIFAIGGSFLNSVMIYTIMAANQQSRLIWPYITVTVFNIAANLIFIPQFSYWGAAVITVFTEILILGISWYIVQKILKLSINRVVVGKTLFSSVAMGGVLYVFRDIPIWSLMIIGVSVYIGLVIITKAVKWREIIRVIPRLSPNK